MSPAALVVFALLLSRAAAAAENPDSWALAVCGANNLAAAIYHELDGQFDRLSDGLSHACEREGDALRNHFSRTRRAVPTQDDCDERVLVTLGAIRASLEMHARILAATVEHHCLQVVEIVEGEEALAGGGASAEAGLVGLVAAAAVLFL